MRWMTRGNEAGAHLFALKRGVLFAFILAACNARLWHAVELRRVARKVRELLVWLGKEKRRVLARRDAGMSRR